MSELLDVYNDMKLPFRNRLVSYEYFFSVGFPEIMSWDCKIPFTFREFRFEIPSLRLMMNNQYNTWDAVDRTRFY